MPYRCRPACELLSIISTTPKCPQRPSITITLRAAASRPSSRTTPQRALTSPTPGSARYVLSSRRSSPSGIQKRFALAPGICDRPREAWRHRARLCVRHLRVCSRICSPTSTSQRLLTSSSFKPQTQQGADILAESLNAHVVMPDFFEPSEPWPADKFPPKTDEESAKLQAFFGGTANPQATVGKLVTVGRALKADGAKFVGAFGFCWGECCRSLKACPIN